MPWASRFTPRVPGTWAIFADSIGVFTVLRFDGYRRAPSLPSQREQRRLLLLVLLIGGVILIPQWLISWRLFAPDTFLNNERHNSRSRVAQPETLSRSQDDSRFAGRSEELLKQLSEIDFSAVEDNTPFGKKETTAWFSTLHLLTQFSVDDLRSANPPWVTFSQLYRNPSNYRRKLVALRGEFRGIAYYPAPANDKGIDGYYQAWLQPERENDPVVVYCLQLPPGFPEGMRIQEPVEVIGVFFKRWVYQAQDGLRVAPVVLTKEPMWKRTPISTTGSLTSPQNILLAVAISVVLTVILLAYLFRPQQRHIPTS